MKTDTELIETLSKHLNDLTSGLCNLALKIFSNEEACRVIKLINDNKPSYVKGNLFWWKCGEKNPRAVFLNNLKEKL